MDHQLINYILATLDDEHGINQMAWNAILALDSDDQATSDAIVTIQNQIDCVEGRYFLPADHPVIQQYRS